MSKRGWDRPPSGHCGAANKNAPCSSAKLAVALGGLAGIGTVGTAFVALGTSLVLGGVAGLISPTPEIPQGPDTEQDPRKSASYSFSGVQNTSRAGTPVPIVYGKTLTGSVVISAGVDTVQIQS